MLLAYENKSYRRFVEWLSVCSNLQIQQTRAALLSTMTAFLVAIAARWKTTDWKNGSDTF